MDEGRISLLPPEVARRIAAGEVIERPASVVRELLENAIDSGAASISLALEGGGIDAVRVSDDGRGIPPEDFPLLCKPHATSKIRTDDDLLRVRTLGFRGEALASIAAVAELELLSSTSGGAAFKLVSRPGHEVEWGPASSRKGTSVTVKALFDRFPARKRFLKRAQTEGSLAAQVFLDRALPHPDIDFRLVADGEPRRMLPPSSLRARVLSAYPVDFPESFFREMKAESDGLSLSIVHGGPEALWPDRRHMQCFVNHRRVQDFSLLKAIEVGFSGFLPGGLFPYAFLFLEVPPDLVDFNIHPAKKEVRFKDSRAVQSFVIRSLARDLSSSDVQRPSSLDRAEGWSSAAGGPSLWEMDAEKPNGRPSFVSERNPAGHWPSKEELAALAASRATFRTVHPDADAPFKVIGQVLGVFIVFEAGDAIHFLDQHAAHERIIFDRLTERKPLSQPLLIPLAIDAVGDDDERLAAHAEALNALGFRLERTEEGSWTLLAHPEGYHGDPGELLSDLADAGNGSEDPTRTARAMTACKSAIKEGDALDFPAMEALVREALSLPEKRCPHGRPIMFSMGREEAYERIRRIVR